MTDLRSAHEEWETFQRSALADAGDEFQRADMQKAFYAGIYFLLQQLKEMVTADLPATEAIEHFQKLEEEIVTMATAEVDALMAEAN